VSTGSPGRQWRERVTIPIFLGGLLLAACALPAAPPGAPVPTPAQSGPYELGDQVNVAEQAGLADTVRVEISEFSDQGEPGYQDAATVEDPETIAQFVEILDTELELKPRVVCVDRYQLRFHLGDGTVHEFGYFCEPDGSFLHGGPPFLTGYDVQPAQRLQALIEEEVSAR
jgi:hypothetical protein